MEYGFLQLFTPISVLLPSLFHYFQYRVKYYFSLSSNILNTECGIDFLYIPQFLVQSEVLPPSIIQKFQYLLSEILSNSALHNLKEELQYRYLPYYTISSFENEN